MVNPDDHRVDEMELDAMSEEAIETYLIKRGQLVKKYALVTLSSEVIINQKKITRLLSESLALEELHISGDQYGACLPLHLPTILPKLKVVTLTYSGSKDPIVSSINPQIIPNWIESCPLLEQFNIEYGSEERQSQKSKSDLLDAILSAQKQCAQMNRPMVKMAFNWRLQVGETKYLKEFNDLGIVLTGLRLRIDNSCGCSDSEKDSFLVELRRLLGSQSDSMETLRLHCSVEVTSDLIFPQMRQLKIFSVLPFSFRKLEKELPIFQPFAPAQFPLLKVAKIRHYHERHGMFANVGQLENVEELLLVTPQEAFLEQWHTIFPNLKKIEIVPASANQLKFITTRMLKLETIIIKVLDANETEMKKLMPKFQNLKYLKSLFFEMFKDQNWVFGVVAHATSLQQIPLLEKLSFRMRAEPDPSQRNILESYHKEVEIEVTKAKCSVKGCECGK